MKSLRSGWITTGPRTKMLEGRLAAYIETGKTDVDCSSREAIAKYSQDEVIVPAYTYTASASAAIHCGATVKFVDIQKDGDPVTHMPEMDYDALEKAIGPKTKAIIPVDLSGIVCDYDRIFEIVKKKNLFQPKESDGIMVPTI